MFVLYICTNHQKKTLKKNREMVPFYSFVLQFGPFQYISVSISIDFEVHILGCFFSKNVLLHICANWRKIKLAENEKNKICVFFGKIFRGFRLYRIFAEINFRGFYRSKSFGGTSFPGFLPRIFIPAKINHNKIC